MTELTIPTELPRFIVPEIVTGAVPEDDRLWVPQGNDSWFRPLMLDTVHGTIVNLLKTRSKGIVSRHYHPGPVHGFVIQGSWKYLEHEWTATEGAYVYEPPGEIHTLVMTEACDEMVTFFYNATALIHIDEDGTPIDFQDVHKKIELCDAHFQSVGLGPDFIRQFVR